MNMRDRYLAAAAAAGAPAAFHAFSQHAFTELLLFSNTHGMCLLQQQMQPLVINMFTHMPMPLSGLVWHWIRRHVGVPVPCTAEAVAVFCKAGMLLLTGAHLDKQTEHSKIGRCLVNCFLQ